MRVTVIEQNELTVDCVWLTTRPATGVQLSNKVTPRATRAAGVVAGGGTMVVTQPSRLVVGIEPVITGAVTSFIL